MKHQAFNTIFILFALFFGLLRSEDSLCSPSQIHLSPGDTYYTASQPNSSLIYNNNQAYLTWHSQVNDFPMDTLTLKDNCSYSVIVFEKDISEPILNITPAFSIDFFYDFTNQNYPYSDGIYHTFAYTALFTGLSYEKLYKYSILDSTGQPLSGPFSFRMTSPNLKESNKKIILLGDIDASPIGLTTINKVQNNFNDYAGIIQLGDIAYDLQDDNGKRGDNFFEAIEEITTQWPMTMALGNHDYYADWSFVNLRIRNPLFNETQNHYYSYNWEGIHFTVTNFDFYDNASEETKNKILSWIENDLKNANTPAMRQQFPFIVFITHRPIYCCYEEQNTGTIIPFSKWCFSFYEKRKIWDELMHKYSVDLVLMADKHSYERMGPIYQNKTMKYAKNSNDNGNHDIIDPAATVYIMNGAGGQNFYTPKPYEATGYTFVADVRPSYDFLYVQNNTEDIRLVFEHYLSETGSKLDYMNLIKTKPKNKEGNRLTVIIAVLVIGGVVVLGYIYWKRRKQEEESQQGGYFRASERDIPLVVLKE